MNVGLRILTTGVAATLLLSATVVGAQTFSGDDIFGSGSDLSIIMTPTHPEPGDMVHLSLKSSTLDLSQSSISWTANGHILKSANNSADIDIPAGNLGTETDLVVSATAPDGGSGAAYASIIPAQVDLLYDSTSFVPPFYRGRSLPSAGTNIRLQAIVHFKRQNGSAVAPSDITYTWRNNGVVVGSVSGRGRSAAIIPAATLYGTNTIEVTAVSSDQKFIGTARVQIPSLEPILMVYQDHPLFGIMYYQALGSKNAIPDTEMTFAATPLFAQAVSANDPHLIYDWKVNDSTIPVDKKNPSEITINSDKSNGDATMSLETTHSSNYFMDSKGSWALTFSNSSSFGSFGGATPHDVFHTGQ